MPLKHTRENAGFQAEVLRIVAAKGNARVQEYDVRENAEPGSVPNWFLGVILLLRDEIQEDEKIVVHDGIIRIVKKTSIDKFLDWVKGIRSTQGADEPEAGLDKELHH